MKLSSLWNNSLIKENVIMLAAILLCFLFAVLFGKKYNAGSGKICLILSRMLIIAAGVLVLIWIFQ